MNKLLEILEADGSLTSAQIAGMMGLSEAEVEARMDDLTRRGVLLGRKMMINWDETDSEKVTALIEVKVTPQKGMGFEDIADEIASYPEVESIYLMSGGFDFTVIIAGRTMKEVSSFVSFVLAPMEGVVSTATHFVLKKYKE